MHFDIADYFQPLDERVLSSSERKIVGRIRDDINSFKEVSDQVKYIKNRRKSTRNRRFDEKVFGIPMNAELDRQKYSDAAVTGKFNDHWNGRESANINPETLSKLATIKSAAITLFKPALVVIAIFIIINIIIYISGLYNSIGKTPFIFCKNGDSYGPSIRMQGATKEKDGYFIPVDYMIAGKGYTGQGWSGDPEMRGKGVFASEDFAFDGDDSFSRENYAIAARWEYVSYSVKENMWPSHAAYGNGTSDGVDTSKPYTNFDSAQYSWTVKQRVLVYNPDNGKAVVVMVGNGVNNPNWGGSPLNAIAGLSYKAQEALGFKAGGLDGGDYDVNVRDSGIELEMWWVDENTPLGPVDAGEIMQGGSSGGSCSQISAVGGGNASIADAAVSLAHENMEVATPNTGPNNGNGTDLYVKVHDKVLAGDPWYQSCDRFVATAVRWAGADDTFPPGSTGTILEYLIKSDKWVEIEGVRSEADLEPGDILIEEGHVIIYAGPEAVQKKFPGNPGVLVHASIGSASSPEQQTSAAITDNRGGAVGNWYNMGFVADGGNYRVFRNVHPEENSIYKNIDLN